MNVFGDERRTSVCVIKCHDEYNCQVRHLDKNTASEGEDDEPEVLRLFISALCDKPVQLFLSSASRKLQQYERIKYARLEKLLH